MKKQTNNIAITILVAVLVGAAAFYGGMQYQKSQGGARAQFANQNGGAGGNQWFGQGRQAGQRPVNGQIVSQDDKSITVKLRDGSSKIVNFSTTIVINKASQATTADLKSGEQVTAFGMTNSDGSITAQNIAIGGGMFGGMRGGMRGGGPDGPSPSGQQ